MDVISEEGFIVINKWLGSKPTSIPQTSGTARAFEKESREYSPVPSDRSGNSAPGPPLARQLPREKFKFWEWRRVYATHPCCLAQICLPMGLMYSSFLQHLWSTCCIPGRVLRLRRWKRHSCSHGELTGWSGRQQGTQSCRCAEEGSLITQQILSV